MEKTTPPKGVYWLSENDYKKAVWSLRSSVTSLFRPLRQYGQGVYCDEAIEHIVRLCEDFGLRVRGVDHPIETELTARNRYESERNITY